MDTVTCQRLADGSRTWYEPRWMVLLRDVAARARRDAALFWQTAHCEQHIGVSSNGKGQRGHDAL